MRLIFIASLNEASSSKNCIRLQRTVDITDVTNAIAFGTSETPGRYNVAYDKQKGEIGDVSFNDEWAQKLKGKLGEIIPIIIQEEYSDPFCGNLN
jgi:hypothetical protein